MKMNRFSFLKKALYSSFVRENVLHKNHNNKHNTNVNGQVQHQYHTVLPSKASIEGEEEEDYECGSL